ncbi:hypothetical protein [uncultured Algoriphagus sp.]|uniref:hypothetical protein n=1 Tax=uncultured Algoriphagus sp. TaxID=417365 RepID=UPI0030EEA010|tara:strand:- start:83416 stop:83700 length:285 start_codon:yes stop_codon:yes gene_type:complete
MKRSLLLLATMVVSAEGFSQSKLKGPRAKNATAIELAANSLPIMFYEVPSDLKGPEAKNKKVWERENVKTRTLFGRRKKYLVGPKAKNKKVWED